MQTTKEFRQKRLSFVTVQNIRWAEREMDTIHEGRSKSFSIAIMKGKKVDPFGKVSMIARHPGPDNPSRSGIVGHRGGVL